MKSLLIWLAALLLSFGLTGAEQSSEPADLGSFDVAVVTVTIREQDTGDTVTAQIYYPGHRGSVDPGQAPYPALVFAPGSLSPSDTYAGNARHLASWGYVVGTFDDFPPMSGEALIAAIRSVFTYFEDENAEAGSLFFGCLDITRFGVVGHSKGGVAALAVAANDARVKAVISLDPSTSAWDHEQEAPAIAAPLAIIAAPPQYCNVQGSYQAVYDVVGAAHRAQFVIAGASHCDFMDTDSLLSRWGCTLVCGGSYNPARTRIAARYTVAWLEYYLKGRTDAFRYLYGSDAANDIAAGRVTRQMDTAPHAVAAVAQSAAVEVTWRPITYPVIAGYNLYRSRFSGDYATPLWVSPGPASQYLDADVTPGERYFYVVRSRDAAGNEHDASEEVSAATAVTRGLIYLPLILFR